MSALTWLCVFLSVGLLNVQCHKYEIRAVADDPVAKKIIELEDQFHRYMDTNNTEGIISMYADDVITARDGGAIKEGKEEVTRNLEWVWSATNIKRPDTHVIPFGANKEYVLEIHASDIIYPDCSTDKLKMAIIWRKVGDEYKIFFEMFNDGY